MAISSSNSLSIVDALNEFFNNLVNYLRLIIIGLGEIKTGNELNFLLFPTPVLLREALRGRKMMKISSNYFRRIIYRRNL